MLGLREGAERETEWWGVVTWAELDDFWLLVLI
jgi:hypothetical protein